MSISFLSTKHFHPGSIKNRAAVYEKEQEQLKEKQRVEERARELAEEIALEKLEGPKTGKVASLRFMYEKPIGVEAKPVDRQKLREKAQTRFEMSAQQLAKEREDRFSSWNPQKKESNTGSSSGDSSTRPVFHRPDVEIDADFMFQYKVKRPMEGGQFVTQDTEYQLLLDDHDDVMPGKKKKRKRSPDFESIIEDDDVLSKLPDSEKQRVLNKMKAAAAADDSSSSSSSSSSGSSSSDSDDRGVKKKKKKKKKKRKHKKKERSSSKKRRKRK